MNTSTEGVAPSNGTTWSSDGKAPVGASATQPSAAPDVGPPPSTWAAAAALLGDLKEAAQGRIKLASLEFKRAGAALGQVVALGLLAAFMLHAAWFALVIGLSWIAVEQGAPSWAVLAVVLLIHVGVAAFAVFRILSLVKRLGMPATMRHLSGKANVAPASLGVKPSVSATTTAAAAR